MTSPGGREVGRISIKILPDTSEFRKRLERQLKAIEDSIRATIDVDVDLDVAGAKEHMRALMAELKATAARGVKVDVGVSGAGTLSRGLSQSLANLGNGASGALGSFNPASLLLIAAVASLAAPALALVSGVLVSLPALLAAVVVPIGAVALGLDGIKKAAEVLKDPLDGLKKTMSSAFEDRFTPIFKNLKAIFPVLGEQLPKVATGLGDMASAFVDSVTSVPGMDKIRNTISNIGTALSTAAPGIGKFTDGILGLISSVSDHLPGLSQFFNQFADRFLNWVDKITKKDWFGNSPLSSAMGSLKESLQGIADLAVRLGTEGFDLLKDPKMGENIRKVFDAIKTFVTDTLPALNKGFDSIATAVDKIATKWGTIEWGLNPLGKVAGNLGTPPVGPKIDENSSGIDVFNADIKLGKLLMAQLMVQALTTFGTIKANAATALSGIWDTVTSSAATAWNGVVSVVQGALSGIGGTLANIPNILSSAWSSLSSIASTAWNAVVSAVSNAMAGAVAAVINGAAQVVAAVVGLGAKVVNACSNFGSLLVGAGAALIQGLINGITSLAQAAIDKAVGIATSVANAVKGALGIHSPSTVFTEIGANTMKGLQNGIDDGSKAVVEKMGTLGKDMGSALQDQLAKIATGGLGIGKDFGMANLDQFMGDIGISGNGALPQIGNMALDWGLGMLDGAITNAIQPAAQGQQALGDTFNIHVNSIDEALSAKQTAQNKRALQYTQR
jgi:phage-related protein